MRYGTSLASHTCTFISLMGTFTKVRSAYLCKPMILFIKNVYETVYIENSVAFYKSLFTSHYLVIYVAVPRRTYANIIFLHQHLHSALAYPYQSIVFNNMEQLNGKGMK